MWVRFTLLFLFICFISTRLNAQQDSVKKTTVTVAALYSSNVSYYGQATSEKLPYLLTNATLRFPLGFYLSAGAYKLLNYGSGISETDLGGGFDYDFNEALTAGTAYTRSFFPSNSPLLQAANENNLNVSVTYQWPWLKSSFNADYAFGTESDVFLSLSQSKEILLGSLFSEKNSVYIEPALELVAGTRHFFETYTIKKGKRDNANGQGKGLVSPVNPKATTTTSVSRSSFNLLSYNFKLPLTLSLGNYLAEISYQLSFAGAGATAELKKHQSFAGLAFYYQF